MPKPMPKPKPSVTAVAASSTAVAVPPARDAAARVRDSVARLRASGGARKSVALTPAAVAALAVLKARRPDLTQDALICQAIEAAAQIGV